MKSLRSVLLAGAAFAVVASPAFAESRPLLLAQAQTVAPTPEAVTAAQAKVDAARAKLREAMASGNGVPAARQALAATIKDLDAARAAAGMPPSGQGVDVGGAPPPAGGQPPAPGQPPAAGQAVVPPAGAPPALKIVPPAGQATGQPPVAPGAQPPAGTAVVPPLPGQPPAAGQAVVPPAGAPPALKIVPPAGQATGQPPVAPGAQPPAGTAVVPPLPGQPPASGQAVAPPAGAPPALKIVPPAGQATGQPPAAPGAPPPAGQAVIPPQPGQPPAAGQAVVPPAAGQGAPPPAGQAVLPTPPAFVPGQKIDPRKFGDNRPRFGENKPEDKPVAPLPQTEAAIKEGQQVQAPDGRVIIKEGGQVTIQHDDAQRFRRPGFQVDTRDGPNGTVQTTVNGPGGSQIVTIKDRDGNILQRYRKNPNGSIEVLIGAVARPPQGGFRAPPPPPPLPPQQQVFDFGRQLPQIVVRIPRDQYIVESSRASQAQIQQTFAAPPVEQVERAYSLEEIRRSARLRDKVRRVDFDTVTFEFGSAVLPDDQIPQVQSIGEAIRQVLATDPSQVFLIEGHTDAVGSDIANLALSDRRAETVAEILSYYFGVPAENMVTQGYGEQYLKVPTTAAERENRRVAFRNITPLMRVGSN